MGYHSWIAGILTCGPESGRGTLLGGPLTLTWEQEHVPAILNVWFGGSEAAYAIGDALFGYWFFKGWPERFFNCSCTS